MRRARLAIGATLLAVTASACGAPPAKSGGAGASVVLRGAAPNQVAAQTLARLAGLHGSVRVVDASRDVQPPVGDEDGAALAAIAAGRVDLAVIRASTLADAGAGALHVLQVPFLIGSDAAAARVASAPVAASLLASVQPLDLVGLALVPGGVRHPFAYAGQAPLTGPDSYRGAAINTRRSVDVDQVFAALGARTDSSANAARSAAAAAGRLRGIESSFHQAGAVDLPATLTADVALYVKFDVVVVRRAAWEALSAAQRSDLRAGVAAAVRAVLAARPSEAAGLAAFCALDGRNATVLAGPGAIAGLRQAAAPAVAAIERDAAVQAAAEAIGAIVVGVPEQPAHAGACPATSTPAPALPSLEPTGDQKAIDGVWRLETSRAALERAGAPPDYVASNAGVWTFTLGNGLLRADAPTGPPCVGAYAISGDRIVLDYAADPSSGCHGIAVGTFARTAARLQVVVAADSDTPIAWDAALFGGGFHRISDLPRAGQDALDGTWRLVTTRDELEQIEPGDSADDVGTWTFHLKAGSGTVDQPSGAPCLIDYRLDGDRVALGFEGSPASHCGGIGRGSFRRRGDRVALDLSGPGGRGLDHLFRHGLQRVG